MKISFISTKDERVGNSAKELAKKYGSQSREIQKRLSQLAAVPNMSEFGFDRPHPLTGIYEGCIAIDLQHPFRIIIRPIGEFEFSKRQTITEIEIVELCKDYH